ncbi:MAG: hypothetical protein M9928_09540 [Anaerolineae bacterium]|nr:hypothetical protein [Anaerolineae bacterium]MCO5192882.1 hypothetical protein [Anaerolineae bacterium]MCO5198287.1 hypothetical protein [Anaerolineae bacterium]MCO5205264.1 hypothetical protein [Anaerolineae bacterium]
MSEQTDTVATSAEAQLQSLGKTESKTAGRMRMRVHSELRSAESMTQIKTNLEAHPDIQDVQINQRTGSVVITHSQKHDSHTLFWEAVKEIDLVAEVALEVPEEGDDGEDPTAKVEQQLADIAYRIDKSIYKRTGENLHMGLLIPAGIAGIGIAQIAIYGIGLELLPGPVLLWIAYDIYKRIGKEPPFTKRDQQRAIPEELPENTTAEAMPEAA